MVETRSSVVGGKQIINGKGCPMIGEKGGGGGEEGAGSKGRTGAGGGGEGRWVNMLDKDTSRAK